MCGRGRREIYPTSSSQYRRQEKSSRPQGVQEFWLPVKGNEEKMREKSKYAVAQYRAWGARLRRHPQRATADMQLPSMQLKGLLHAARASSMDSLMRAMPTESTLILGQVNPQGHCRILNQQQNDEAPL